ncbi:hypothetical protein BMETH_11481922042, partial [methanotrophic bacterial endosymbiont of Bathymodiolus sp.]
KTLQNSLRIPYKAVRFCLDIVGSAGSTFL